MKDAFRTVIAGSILDYLRGALGTRIAVAAVPGPHSDAPERSGACPTQQPFAFPNA